jgi:TetR/AcrR family transcriptional regulator, regulator of cefoperazone and chloramphenicol sensitivity
MEEKNPADASERILDTVVTMLLERKAPSDITNREIARVAGVNSALINYYYRSKENLLQKAMEVCMTKMAGDMLGVSADAKSPVKRLKSFLYGISAFALEHSFLSELSISAELKSGNLNTVQTILPLLREIFGNKRGETALRLAALQIIVPLQAMLLNMPEYKKSLGRDISKSEASLELIDMLIDNIVGKEK